MDRIYGLHLSGLNDHSLSHTYTHTLMPYQGSCRVHYLVQGFNMWTGGAVDNLLYLLSLNFKGFKHMSIRQ